MTKKKVEFEITRPKFLVAAALAITGLIASVHLFITYVVFPAAERFIVVDVPAKSGGQTFYVTDAEYQSTSSILLGVAAALLAAVLLLVAAHKYVAAFLASFVYAMAGGFYAAIMLGNGFHELWGGWWSALGVVIAVVLYFGAVALIVWSAYKKPGVPTGN